MFKVDPFPPQNHLFIIILIIFCIILLPVSDFISKNSNFIGKIVKINDFFFENKKWYTLNTNIIFIYEPICIIFVVKESSDSLPNEYITPSMLFQIV